MIPLDSPHQRGLFLLRRCFDWSRIGRERGHHIIDKGGGSKPLIQIFGEARPRAQTRPNQGHHRNRKVKIDPFISLQYLRRRHIGRGRTGIVTNTVVEFDDVIRISILEEFLLRTGSTILPRVWQKFESKESQEASRGYSVRLSHTLPIACPPARLPTRPTHARIFESNLLPVL